MTIKGGERRDHTHLFYFWNTIEVDLPWLFQSPVQQNLNSQRSWTLWSRLKQKKLTITYTMKLATSVSLGYLLSVFKTQLFGRHFQFHDTSPRIPHELLKLHWILQCLCVSQEDGGASEIVKAKSSGEDPRASGGLVSNLPHPEANRISNTPEVGCENGSRTCGNRKKIKRFFRKRLAKFEKRHRTWSRTAGSSGESERFVRVDWQKSRKGHLQKNCWQQKIRWEKRE